MAVRMFDNRLEKEWIGFVVLRRSIIAAAIVHFSLAAASGYRAIVQVYDLTIETPSTLIEPGTPFTVKVSTSGRTHVDVNVDLVQGARSSRLAHSLIHDNDSFFYDPRPKRTSIGVVLPRAIPEGFSTGPAMIRAVATGRSQWMRTPPPTAAEAKVTLKP